MKKTNRRQPKPSAAEQTAAALDGWLAQRAVPPSPRLQAKRDRLLKLLAKGHR